MLQLVGPILAREPRPLPADLLSTLDEAQQSGHAAIYVSMARLASAVLLLLLHAAALVYLSWTVLSAEPALCTWSPQTSWLGLTVCSSCVIIQPHEVQTWTLHCLQGTLGQLLESEMLSLAAGLSGLPNKVLWRLLPADMPGVHCTAHAACANTPSLVLCICHASPSAHWRPEVLMCCLHTLKNGCRRSDSGSAQTRQQRDASALGSADVRAAGSSCSCQLACGGWQRRAQDASSACKLRAHAGTSLHTLACSCSSVSVVSCLPAFCGTAAALAGCWQCCTDAPTFCGV